MKTSQSCKINLLVAYPYFTKAVSDIIVKHQDKIRLLLDCGAFTSWNRGKEIKLDDYCKFIDNMPIKPWRYFMLDVIGDAKQTYLNYCEMLKRGYSPIPIFTQGESPSMLETYYETSEVIGMGSLVGTKGNQQYVQWLMKYVGDRKIHWLGFTRLDFIKKFHPYMCDSSSWSLGQRFGLLYLYEGSGKQPLILKRKNFLLKPDPKTIKIISDYGHDYRDLQKKESWKSVNTVTRITAASWIALSYDVYKKLGTHLFLAAANNGQIETILREFIYQVKTKRIK